MMVFLKYPRGDTARVLLVLDEDERGLVDVLLTESIIITLVPVDQYWLRLASQADIIVLDCHCARQVADAGRIRFLANRIPILALAPESLQSCQACSWACDDLLLRPFIPEVFHLRLKRLLEKARLKPLQVGDLCLDPATGSAWRRGRQLHMTPLEFSLLAYLMHNPGRLVSYDELLTAVWGYDWDEGSPQVVKAAVKRLRRKVETDPSQPKLIVNVWGRGYRLEVLG
jgi:DNA-binding response OmpR family regulator